MSESKVFVGMLEKAVTEEALNKVFADYGNPTFSKKGRNRVATFSSEELATKAISELNGKNFEGVSYADKGLRVEAIKPKKKKPAAPKAEAKAAPAKAAPAKAAVDTAKQAFVGNLDRTGTAEALEKDFSIRP